MAELVLKNPFVKLGTSGSPSTNLWQYMKSLTLTYSADIVDKTASGDAFRSKITGLKDWNVTIEFNQDYSTGTIDTKMWGLVGVESSNCWMEIRPTTAVVSGTNPRYTGRALLESYPVIAGSIGDLAIASVTFQGDGVLTRNTSG